MNEEKYGVMSVTHMLDKAVDIHKKHMGTSALYLFVMSILIAVIGILFSFIIIPPFSLLMTRSIIIEYGAFEPSYPISVFVLIAVITLLFYSLESIKQSGIITIGSYGFLRKKVDISDAIMGAFKNILRVLSVVIAGIILFLPIALVCFSILFFIFSNHGYDLSGEVLSIVGAILVSIVFIVAFVYYMTIHAFSVQIAIIERAYFFKALKRSRELVKGRFWKTLGCFASSSLMITFVNISIYTIFGLIGGIIYLVLRSANISTEMLTMLLMLVNVVRIPLQMLISYFITPIVGIFTTILYYNIRFKKEGYDIILNVLRLKSL